MVIYFYNLSFLTIKWQNFWPVSLANIFFSILWQWHIFSQHQINKVNQIYSPYREFSLKLFCFKIRNYTTYVSFSTWRSSSRLKLKNIYGEHSQISRCRLAVKSYQQHKKEKNIRRAQSNLKISLNKPTLILTILVPQ